MAAVRATPRTARVRVPSFQGARPPAEHVSRYRIGVSARQELDDSTACRPPPGDGMEEAMVRTTVIDVDTTRTPLIRWGAVTAGAIWGLAVMALLGALWLALAFPSGTDFVVDNLEWFMAASGAIALLVAGVVAGVLTDNRGPVSGWLHGMTAWGVLLIGALVFGLPSVFGLFSAGELRTIEGGDLIGPGANDALWATFLTLLAGAFLAGLGGMIGGAPTRSVGSAGSRVPGTESDLMDDDSEVDGRREADRPLRDHSDGSSTDVDDRVMVRRSPDGSYVDQDGRRYFAESAGRE